MDENELHEVRMAAGGASMDMMDALDAETLEQITGLQRDVGRLIGMLEERGVGHRAAVCAVFGAFLGVVVVEDE